MKEPYGKGLANHSNPESCAGGGDSSDRLIPFDMEANGQTVADRRDRAELPARVRNVVSWAVGVTTAPRRLPTLETTLRSLAAAGWDCPRLFAEPGVEIPPSFADLPRTVRDEPLGAFPSWYLALAELVMRQPRAEAYMMVQDDVVFARNIRPFLERALWPAANCGCVSIYCPSNYAVGRRPGFYMEDRGWRTWTAQALIFPNPAARSLIGSALPVSHRFLGPRSGSRNIDCLVGAWCRQAGRPFYVFTPSLGEHVGHASTLYPHATLSGYRGSSTFVGENTDVAGEMAPRWSEMCDGLRPRA